MCIDYRKFNSVTIKDAYLIPNIDSILDSFSRAKVFSKLDALLGYHQIGMHGDDIQKIAFASRSGIYEFLKMLFGLKMRQQHFKESCMKYLLMKKGNS